ncbi:MAG: hypothetical protein WC767_00385 [Candidatus Paceibacterota bacterium]
MRDALSVPVPVTFTSSVADAPGIVIALDCDTSTAFVIAEPVTSAGVPFGSD